MKSLTIENLFSGIAQRYGERVAVEWPARSLTYAELESLSNRLGNYLAESGAPPGSVVAILSDNVPDILISMIGILKSSCAFLPLDPRLPEHRLAEMCTIASPRWFLTESAHLATLKRLGESSIAKAKVIMLDDGGEKHSPANGLELLGSYLTCQDQTPCEVASDPDAMCSIFFTSGSTGRPKAIAGRRKGLGHFVRWEIETLGVNAQSRISQLTLPSFDGFLKDTFVPLCAGGTVCVPDSRETILDAHRLAAWVDKEEISILHCVPTIFRSILNTGLDKDYFPSLNYVVMAGEAVQTADIKRWFRVFGERIQLVNLYGPTETTVTKLFHFIKPADEARRSIPIGKPMPGAAAVIVGPDGQICPPGVAGEIYIRTPYRALGYYNQPDLTQEAFIRNPFTEDAHDIVYKTGDLGRILNDGNFEFVGRLDQQVKIRGVRIELAEIEGALRRHEAIKDTVVTTPEDSNGDKYLFAYVVLHKTVAFRALREFLASYLPSYMLPSAFMELEALPLTPNGKIDRQRLPDPHQKQSLKQTEVEPPRSLMEEKIASVWTEVLRRSPIGIHDNFFELGGHSLLVVQLVARLRAAFQIELPLRKIFEAPTIADLGKVIETMMAEGACPAAPVIVRRPREKHRVKLSSLDARHGLE